MPAVLTSSVIDVEIALRRLDGNRSLLAAMAGFFLEDSPNLLRQLHLAILADSMPQVVRIAHGLRGLVSTFEATRVMDLVSEIERSGRKSDHSTVKSLARELDGEMTHLTAALQKVSQSAGVLVA